MIKKGDRPMPPLFLKEIREYFPYLEEFFVGNKDIRASVAGALQRLRDNDHAIVFVDNKGTYKLTPNGKSILQKNLVMNENVRNALAELKRATRLYPTVCPSATNTFVMRLYPYVGYAAANRCISARRTSSEASLLG